MSLITNCLMEISIIEGNPQTLPQIRIDDVEAESCLHVDRIMYSWRWWRSDDVNLDKLRRFLLISTFFKLKNLCSHVVCAIIAFKLMRIDTSRVVMDHPCGSDMYRLDANCLVKKPKYVTIPGVCPSILITHCLGNRGHHLLWHHLRGMLLCRPCILRGLGCIGKALTKTNLRYMVTMKLYFFTCDMLLCRVVATRPCNIQATGADVYHGASKFAWQNQNEWESSRKVKRRHFQYNVIQFENDYDEVSSFNEIPGHTESHVSMWNPGLGFIPGVFYFLLKYQCRSRHRGMLMK
jgi:hypothetical protein